MSIAFKRLKFFSTANEEKYLGIQPAFMWVLLYYLINEDWCIPWAEREYRTEGIYKMN